MLFWAIIVHFNRSVTVQCDVALDGLVNFHIYIYIYVLWGPTVSGAQTTLEEARSSI